MQPHKYRPRLNAGELNRRITIRKKGRTEDEAGYPIPNPPPEDVCTIWASRKPLRGRELFAADAAQSEITVRYRIRYRDGITSDMWLYDHRDKREYKIIVPLDDVYNDRTETHLMVSEMSNG